MRKLKILLALGIFTAVLPYLGFPYEMKNLLTSASGLAVIYLGYIIYSKEKVNLKEKQTFDNFSENSDFVETEKELVNSPSN